MGYWVQWLFRAYLVRHSKSVMVIFSIELQINNNTTILFATNVQEVTSLVDQNHEIFREAQGLPPQHTIEHSITLLEGHSSMNVRLYHYPHHHKNEIEKQVQELLHNSMIRHSQSAYSNAIIFGEEEG